MHREQLDMYRAESSTEKDLEISSIKLTNSPCKQEWMRSPKIIQDQITENNLKLTYLKEELKSDGASERWDLCSLY